MQTGTQVAQQAVSGILQRLDALAAKIGTTAAQLWQVYLAQSKVEAIRDCTSGLLMILIGVVVCFKLIPFFWSKQSAARKKCEYDGDGWAAAGIIGAIVCVMLAVLAVSFLYASVGEFMNPSYWAFQHLTADLRNLL